MLATEVCGLAGGLHVQDEIDVALFVAKHILGAVLCDGGEAEGFEEFREYVWIRRRKFDELETVGA